MSTKIKSEGVRLIAAERERQVVAEGWTLQHDAGHRADVLARAAACYAIPARLRRLDLWPWESRYWKPSPDDRLCELVKAGALIAAEIDRLAAVTPDSTDDLTTCPECGSCFDASDFTALTAPGVSVSAEQVEAVARIVEFYANSSPPVAARRADPTTAWREHFLAAARKAAAALGVTVTDEGTP